MIAKTVAILLADLGVAKSHSRPHVSNDNPYSEAQFKTLKYRPDYPDRFGSVADARQWGRGFFAWYNDQHHHTGLALLTPATVHTGRAETVRQQRQVVLQQAYQAHPERFVRGRPQPTKLPEAVWINPPPSPADLSAPAPQTATARWLLRQAQVSLQRQPPYATLTSAGRRIGQRCGATRAPCPPTV